MAQGWSRPSGLTVTEALKVVGVEPAAVEELGGSILAGKDAFLVGSLAAGLGNAGSDIDVHVFEAEPQQQVGMIELFVGDRPVEVQKFSRAVPENLMAGFHAHARLVTLPVGPCCLGEPPARATQRRMAHWLYALPLRTGVDEPAPIFTAADADMAHAVLVRGALNEAVLCAASAWLAERADLPSRPYLWRRAGRWLLETIVRAAGQLFVAEKWLPIRTRRAGIDPAVARELYSLSCRADFDRVVGQLGLPPLDIGTVVRVDVYPDAQEISIGKKQYLVMSKARLVERGDVQPGSLAGLVDAVGPAAALEAVAVQVMSPSVDTERLDAVLR